MPFDRLQSGYYPSNNKKTEERLMGVDDLGLPECTDLASFARAFEAMVRERANRAALH